MKIKALIAGTAFLFCASAATAQVMPDYQTLNNETVASGFVGSSFGDDIADEHFNFGGSLAWLWKSTVGAEFLATFAPDTVLANGVDEAQVHNYMANAIAAVPLGQDGRWQPFVSGGIGAVTFRVDDDEFDLDAPDETELGGNIGFGLMGFAQNWGFRGDVRYFTGIGGEVVSSEEPVPPIDDFDFWRANAGIAYRW